MGNLKLGVLVVAERTQPSSRKTHAPIISYELFVATVETLIPSLAFTVFFSPVNEVNEVNEVK